MQSEEEARKDRREPPLIDQQTPTSAPNPEVTTRIRMLVSIAAASGSSMSVTDLALLMPDDSATSADALESLLRLDKTLCREFVVSHGHVVPRGKEKLLLPGQRQDLADELIGMGRELAAKLFRLCPWTLLVAISGSAAYGQPEPDDDLDFFVVSSRNRMWLTLLCCLVLAKLDHLRAPSRPVYCFNRVQEDTAPVFGTSEEPLYAREALSLQVVVGGSYYRNLLVKTQWMARYFPRLYRAQVDAAPRGDAQPRNGHQFLFVVNALAFLAIGPYLWALGLYRSRRFRKDGDFESEFRTVVRRSRLAYESQKFDTLKDAYRSAI